jgi:hypothetical protein
MHNSGESRRGIADARLNSFWLFEKMNPLQFAEYERARHYASSPRKRGPITTSVCRYRAGRSSLLNTHISGYGSRLARSLSSGARLRGPLAWPGRRRWAFHRNRFCSSKFSAVAVNTCMLASRSALPVSSVVTDCLGPATAMQLWPAASP